MDAGAQKDMQIERLATISAICISIALILFVLLLFGTEFI